MGCFRKTHFLLLSDHQAVTLTDHLSHQAQLQQVFWGIVLSFAEESKPRFQLDSIPQDLWTQLYSALSKHGLWPLFAHIYPEVLSEEQSLQIQQHTLQQLHLYQEQQRLQSSSLEVGLDLYFWKGPQLSQRLYHDPCRRQSLDLDILVQASQWEKTLSWAQQEGYLVDNTESILKSKRQSITIEHPKRNTLLDLSYEVLSPQTHLALTEALFHSRQNKSHDSIGLLCLLAVHGGKHQWERILWLLDIQKLLQTMSLQELEMAQDWSIQNLCEKFLAEALFLVDSIWGLKDFPQIRPWIFQHRPTTNLPELYPKELGLIQFHRGLSQKLYRSKWWYWLDIVTSPSAEDQQLEGVMQFPKRIWRLWKKRHEL